MMRFRAFIAISVLLVLICSPALACGPWYYDPSEYCMFRISENYLTGATHWQQFNYGSDENCLLWQQQTSKNIPLYDIYAVVYGSRASASWVDDLLHHRKTGPLWDDGNRFCSWLWKDREAAEFLLLAKQCEETRDRMASPWYYPSSMDPDKLSLKDIVEKADEYGGSRFSDRYLLQTERALFSMHEYDECINRWNEKSASVPDNIIRRLTLRYVAGAYFNLGEVDKAMQLFGEAGDVESVLYCSNKTGIARLEDLYEYSPSSRELRDEVERCILSAETRLWKNTGPLPADSAPSFEEKTRVRLEQIRSLSLRIADEGKVDDPDLWYYTAAFIDHLFGRNPDASWLLAKAESAKGSAYIKESVKVLRIYLDSLEPCNKAWEARMLAGVKWLESKIVGHIDEGREETVRNGMYYTGINFSYFYWNDMLRKIVHSGIVPSLLKSGRDELAIAYFNMADNLIFNLVGEIDTSNFVFDLVGEPVDSRSAPERVSLQDYRSKGTFNGLDYSNLTFKLLDSLSVGSLIRYVQELTVPGSDAFRYLNARGYTDKDYFNEIIGTRLIREMRYAEAQTWLAKVSPAFQSRLNTFRGGYLSFDPFSPERRRTACRSDVKYDFAREMASLEKSISETKDPDRKALLMVRYATGLKNSMGNCWALSFYSLFSADYNDAGSRFMQAQSKGFDRAERMYATALSICGDKETAARINLALGNGRTVVSKYRTTRTAEYVRGHCDTYVDYHFEQRSNFWGH